MTLSKIGITTESDMGVAFQKLLCITIIHLPRFRIKQQKYSENIIVIHTVVQKFAYPCAIRYVDFMRFYGTLSLKEQQF